MSDRLPFRLVVLIGVLGSFAGCTGRGTTTLPFAPTAAPAVAPQAPSQAQAVVAAATPAPNFLGYISYYWGDKTQWTINCGAPTYYPPNTCLLVKASGATQLGGPALAVNEFVAITANAATASSKGITALSFTTSLTPFPGSPLPPGYTGPTPGPTATPSSGPTATPSSGPTATPSSGPTATPSSGPTATPNFLGYISYYWNDPKSWTINCGAPTYYPPNTCLPVNAASATKLGGPALAVNEFVAITANAATASSKGITALSFTTSLTPFPGSPLPPGYTGPTPAPTASPIPTATPVSTPTPTAGPPTPAPTGPATPPSTNFLGYISYYWGDPKLWTINCGAPTYYPPNTCLAVNAATATQAGGPAPALGDFVAIYANPQTAGATGITAITFAVSLTPFAGSPLPPGYTGPTPAPTATPTASPTPAPAADWPTFGNNNWRTGESSDATLSAANVGTLHYVWAHQNFDGFGAGAQTQPVVATGVNVGGVTHNVVYVGSGNGTLFAYDAYTGALLWSKLLGQGQYSCSAGSTAYFGVQGTPAIDKANNVIYASDGVHRIHALDLGSGAERWSVDAVAAGSDNGTNSNLHEFVHTALTFANGKIYGGTSSSCDITPWQGRVFAVDASSHTVSTFFTAYNQGGAYSGGGVWGWGGVSVDGGSVFAAVGNTDTEPQTVPFVQAPYETSGYGEQVVALSSGLTSVLGSNSPSFTENPSTATDIDLSGTPVLFQPPGCPPLLAVQGKAGFLFIYNRNNLSQLAQFQFAPSADTPHFTGLPAYSSATHLLYASTPTSIGSYGPGMAFISFGSLCTPVVAQQPRFGPDSFTGFTAGYNHGRSTPTYANGVVFMGTADGVLWARDATTGNPLWDSNNTGGLNAHGQQWVKSASAGGDQIRFGPVVTGGWVYVVEAMSGSLYALTVDATSASAASMRRAITSRPLPAPSILRPQPRL